MSVQEYLQGYLCLQFHQLYQLWPDCLDDVGSWISQPYRPPRHVTGIALLFCYILFITCNMSLVVCVAFCLCGLVVKNSWLQIQRLWFDFRHYQICWEILGLERGPLSLVTTIEELLERNRSGSGLESREYDHRDPSFWQRDTLYPQKLALSSLTSGGRSVGIFRFRTQATEFSFLALL
jgi:hypothetical protein